MKMLRRAGIAVAGSAVLLLGVVTLPIPGVPCCLIIPAGLAILALEFAWAQRWLAEFKRRMMQWRGGKAEPGITE